MIRVSAILRRDHLPEEREDVGGYIVAAGMAEKFEVIHARGETIVRGHWYGRDIDVGVIFFLRALRANPVVGMVYLEID